MKISVIIPVYNRAKMVKKTITSVLEQTYLPLEIIIIDDGSTDNTANILNEFQFSLSRESEKPLPALKIIKQDNQGVSAARNLGIKESKTDWLAFLDSDDYWLPSKLEKQVKFHKKNPSILISQTNEIWIRDGLRVNPKKYHQKPKGDIFRLSLSRCLITPSAVMLHKNILDDVGLFDEEMPVCEDYDLWLRIACGYKVGLVKEKLVVKIGGHADQLSQKYWGMDRFRVKALEKILQNNSLNLKQQEAVVDKLIEKLSILCEGARKRDKMKDVNKYKQLIEKYSGKIGQG